MTTSEPRVATPPRQRFVAPPREAVDPACFDAPVFDAFGAHRAWLTAASWPTLAELNAALGERTHPHAGTRLHFVAQTPDLLADGLHYEQRIHAQGAIATRERNWHDLFNALVWIAHPALKAALNARQVADIARVGPRERTRGQCALTHFDEAGAIVLLRDAALLEAWDAHDWTTLFWRQRAAWSDGRAEVVVFGHALLEHALQPRPVHSAKCLAIMLEREAGGDETRSALAACARHIADDTLLTDPQQLRPLPLSGLPRWHPDGEQPSFYTLAPCFRPLREGRRYPAPLYPAAGAG